TEARQDELRETFSEELMRMNGRLAPVFLAHQKDLSGEGVVENPTTGMEFIHSLLSCSLAFDVLANNPEDLLSSDHSRSMLIETEIEHAVLNSESITRKNMFRACKYNINDYVLDQLPIKHRKLDEECMSMYSTASNNLTLNLTRFDPNHGHQTQFRQRCIYHCSITSRASPFTT
ncbi:hypothetical protein PSHT_12679, partial [Puccinia striiformis]